MKSSNLLQEDLENDLIDKIYNNDFNVAEREPSSEEYKKIILLMRKQEKKLLSMKGFKKYLEMRNIKDAIEAEEQFKLGFKTAIQIIIESYHF